MPYVIKHREKELFVPGSKSRKAKRHELYLVEKEWTKIYPTLQGARSALASWAEQISYTLKGFEGIDQSPEELKDLMEIVEVDLSL